MGYPFRKISIKVIMELVNKNIEINSQPKYLNDITQYAVENIKASNTKMAFVLYL